MICDQHGLAVYGPHKALCPRCFDELKMLLRQCGETSTKEVGLDCGQREECSVYPNCKDVYIQDTWTLDGCPYFESKEPQ